MLSSRHLCEALVAGAVAVGCSASGIAPDPAPAGEGVGSRVTFTTSCDDVETRSSLGDILDGGFVVDAFSSGTGTAHFRNAKAWYNISLGHFDTDRCWPASGSLDFFARYPGNITTAAAPGGIAICARPSDGDVLVARETGCEQGDCTLHFEHCFARLDAVRLKFGSSFLDLLAKETVTMNVSVSDASGYWLMPFDSSEDSGWADGSVSGCHPGAATDLGKLAGKQLGDIIKSKAALLCSGEIEALSGLGLYLAPTDGATVSVEFMIGDTAYPDRYFLLRGTKPLDLSNGVAYDLVLEFPSAGELSFTYSISGTEWLDGGEYGIIY